MRATKARMRSRATFAGPGYNPKAINLRAKPPPFAEKKFHELGQDATTIQNIATTTTPAHSGFSSLNLISYGDSMSTRNGNKVLLDSISLRGRCIVDKNSDPSFANVVSTTTIFRIVVFLDTQCNGGSPTMDEFFDTQLVSQDAFDCYTIAQYRQIQDTPRQKSHGATGTLLHGQYPNPRHSSLPRRRNGVLLPSQKPQNPYHVLRRI